MLLRNLEDSFVRRFKPFQPKVIIQFSVKVKKRLCLGHDWVILGPLCLKLGKYHVSWKIRVRQFNCFIVISLHAKNQKKKNDETVLGFFLHGNTKVPGWCIRPFRGTGNLLSGKKKEKRSFPFIFVTTDTDVHFLPSFMLFVQSTRLTHCFARFYFTKSWQSRRSKYQLKSCRLSEIGERVYDVFLTKYSQENPPWKLNHNKYIMFFLFNFLQNIFIIKRDIAQHSFSHINN